MSRHCPKCGYGDSSRERRPNGNTTCNACGYSVLSSQWDIEEAEVEFKDSNNKDAPAAYERSQAMAIIMEQVMEIADLKEHIDNLEWVINDNTDMMNTLRLLHWEEKNHSEKLELEVEHLRRKIDFYNRNKR